MSGRTLALDVGSVRIGVAVSDPLGMFAQSLGVWRVDDGWRAKLDDALRKYEPRTLLIGLPVRTTGELGVEARRILDLVDELRAAYPDLAIETWDERYSTVIANQVLLEADVSREKRKGKVDKIAATVILQGWLDRAR